MYFLALATDFDGTLAHDGVMPATVRPALERFRGTGGRVILVTGRELPDLRAILPDLSIFDLVVAENGALLLNPATGEERLLAPPPPPALVEKLRHRGVMPLAVGRAIIATWEPHEATVLSVIHELGLDMQIAFNKGAVMVLPAGVSKSSGLAEALAVFGLSPRNVVGVGDAENDHSFLAHCGLSAAVANATTSLKSSVDLVLQGRNGDGVVELLDRMRREDQRLAPLACHGLLMGHDMQGTPAYLAPGDGPVIILGPSGAGKSTLGTSLTEQMAAHDLNFCVFDPEGDYLGLRHALSLGGSATPPNLLDGLRMLSERSVNLVFNAQALTVDARRRGYARLIEETAKLRARTGRPHWLLIDEAHEVIPAAEADTVPALPPDTPQLIYISLDPGMLAPAILRVASTLLIFGHQPRDLLEAFCSLTDRVVPAALPAPDAGELLCWRPHRAEAPTILRPLAPRQHHHRHIGKYAAGDVGPWHSFYFRGPDQELNRPARNLYAFIDLADQVAPEVWMHHLRAGDYSTWFRDVIRDETLASEAENVEGDANLSADESRRRIKHAIWRRYAAPCERLGEAL